MVEQYIEQLKSDDPVKRRQAIIALGKAGDESALRPLANLIKTDPDPVLRELALRAGKHIRGLSAQTTLKPSTPAATPTTVSPFVEQAAPVPFTDEPSPAVSEPPQDDSEFKFAFIGSESAVAAAEAQPARKQIKPRDKELAKGKLDTAIGFKLQGNNERAIVALADALRLDPDLASESVTINLATGLTSTSSPKEAIAEVIKQAGTPKGKGGAKAQGAAVDPQAFNMLLELLIYFVVTLLLVITVGVTLSRLFDNLIAAGPPSRAALRNPFLGMNTAGLLGNALVFAATTTILTLVGNAVVYVVGTFLGGSGDLFRVISAMIRVQIVATVVFAVGFLLVIQAGPAAFSRRDPPASMLLAGGIFVIGGLGSLIGMAYAVARAHEVGFWKGMFIVIVGSIAEGCVMNLLSIALYNSQVVVP